MISYLRRNHVAFLALFVAIVLSGGTAAYAANTIRSSDIVDGQVQNADLGANVVGNGKIQDGSVLGADIKDNALGGADIKDDSLSGSDIKDNALGGADIRDDSLSGSDIGESTLGQVPNAKTVDGVPLGELQHTSIALAEQTDKCSKPGIWSECGFLELAVPAGHAYLVTVTSSMTANPGGAPLEGEFCPSKDGPTCIDGNPDAITLPANTYTNSTIAASDVFGSGTHLISTAVHFNAALAPTIYAHTSTTVDYEDIILIKQSR